ncbi:hypothetical protein [Sphingomonas sp. 3P27F8]|uniref:hypothetical protein n=1 Tax=Sphingomonas sp. 3P27F8 TaxID=2502213 RepID=UPI0020162EAC|nr:hypothetical protein [Sphingomonas sp. 3P27F8]
MARHQTHAIEAQLLADPTDVLTVAGDTVQALAYDEVNLSCADRAQQLHQAWTVTPIAADLGVRIGGYDGASDALDQRLARRGLVVARLRVLFVCAVSRIDRDAGCLHDAS